MSRRIRLVLLLALSSVAASVTAQPGPDRPWLNPALSSDQRAQLAVQAMTEDEKLELVLGYFATKADWKRQLHAAAGCAIRICRICSRNPAPRNSAAVANGRGRRCCDAGRSPDEARAHRASFWAGDARQPGIRNIAFEGGRMIGSEARASGFNVMLAGGVDLERDPRNGRNFEYGGEDPLLAGTIVGSEIAGIQSNHIISTAKHYASERPRDGS